MLLMTIFYIGLGVFIYLGPQKYWDFLFSQYTHGSERINQFVEKILDIIPGHKSDRLRKELLLAMKYRELKLRKGVLTSNEVIPDYQFFGRLVAKLMFWMQQYGVDATTIFADIRDQILKEGKYQRKISLEVKETILQVSVVAATIWGFVYLSDDYFVEKKSSSTIFFIMGGLQIIGILFLASFSKYIRGKAFQGYDVLYRSLYGLSSMFKIGLSFQESLREVPLNNVWSLRRKYRNLQNDLADTIQTWKSGNSPEEDFNYLIAEVDFLFEQDLEKVKKQQQILKFLVLSLFFLPTYFIYLGRLFSGFVIN